MSAHRFVFTALAVSALSTVAYAQSVVSAHSGTLHYFDGTVTIDGKSVEQKAGRFPEVKDNSVLRTGLGRAEILLTPGVFLRMGENSSFRMLDNRLLSTRIEFLEGSAMIEADDPETSVKDPAVTILYKDYTIQPVKFGLFELTSGQLRVYKGQAAVTSGTNRVVVKEGRQLPFSAALLVEKFDDKNVDDLYLWTRDRSSHLSAANMASARSVANQSMLDGSLFGGAAFTMPWVLGPVAAVAGITTPTWACTPICRAMVLSGARSATAISARAAFTPTTPPTGTIGTAAGRRGMAVVPVFL